MYLWKSLFSISPCYLMRILNYSWYFRTKATPFDFLTSFMPKITLKMWLSQKWIDWTESWQPWHFKPTIERLRCALTDSIEFLYNFIITVLKDNGQIQFIFRMNITGLHSKCSKIVSNVPLSAVLFFYSLFKKEQPLWISFSTLAVITKARVYILN